MERFAYYTVATGSAVNHLYLNCRLIFGTKHDVVVVTDLQQRPSWMPPHVVWRPYDSRVRAYPLKRSRFGTGFTGWEKLLAWNLTQYTRVVVFDADVLYRRPVDELFLFKPDCTFAAARDDGFVTRDDEHMFNSGLLVLRPSVEFLDELLRQKKADTVWYDGRGRGLLWKMGTVWNDGGDQGLLWEAFRGRGVCDVPQRYNRLRRMEPRLSALEWNATVGLHLVGNKPLRVDHGFETDAYPKSHAWIRDAASSCRAFRELA